MQNLHFFQVRLDLIWSLVLRLSRGSLRILMPFSWTYLCSFAMTSGTVPSTNWWCSNSRGLTLLSCRHRPGIDFQGTGEGSRILHSEETMLFSSWWWSRPALYSLGDIWGEFHQPAYMCFMDLEKEFDHHTSQHSAPVQESLICISSNKSGLFLPFVQDSLHNF